MRRAAWRSDRRQRKNRSSHRVETRRSRKRSAGLSGSLAGFFNAVHRERPIEQPRPPFAETDIASLLAAARECVIGILWPQ